MLLGPCAYAAAAQLLAGAALLAHTDPDSFSHTAVALAATTGVLTRPLARIATRFVRDTSRVHHLAGQVWAVSVQLFFAMAVAGAYDGTGSALAEKLATPFVLAVVVGLSFATGAQGALLAVSRDAVVHLSVTVLAMTAIKLRVAYTHTYLALHVACLGSIALGYVCVCRHVDLREVEREGAEAILRTAVLTKQPYVVTDAQLTILAVNRRFTDVLGYEADEVYGKNVSVVLETSVDTHWVQLATTKEKTDHVWSVVTKAGPRLPVRITFGETRCPANGSRLYYAKFASMVLEQRNAQLVAEKERLAWDLASCVGACERDSFAMREAPGRATTIKVDVRGDGNERLGAATHRTLGAMQDPEVTRRAVSCARSYDHVDSRDASPVAPGASGTRGSARTVAPPPPSARSDASGTTVVTLVSSVMDTVSVAAAKDVTRAPPPTKDVRLRRPTKTSSEPKSSKPTLSPRDHAPSARGRAQPLPAVECNVGTADLREYS